jgi:hypothetical protein
VTSISVNKLDMANYIVIFCVAFWIETFLFFPYRKYITPSDLHQPISKEPTFHLCYFWVKGPALYPLLLGIAKAPFTLAI